MIGAEFVVRLIGMVVLAIGGVYLGSYLSNLAGDQPLLWASVFALVGALMGLIVTPFLTTRPVRAIRSQMTQVSARTMISGTIGLIVGLIIAALVASPLSLLPAPFSQILPLIGAVVLSYLGVTIFVMRQNDIFNVLSSRLPQRGGENEEGMQDVRNILLDTSVIIDGRVADIARTGFIYGTMMVPSFVLNELQHIADSPDALRRNRGRRGLDMLNRLKEESVVPVRITDMDAPDAHQVDDKLIQLAKALRCPIVTNDYNMNRVAQLQGVLVLNINELANAVKSVLLPGETISVRIIQEGKELGQGVGYLDDGTMIVIEEGRPYIGQTIPILVKKVLQKTEGRLVFAQPALDG